MVNLTADGQTESVVIPLMRKGDELACATAKVLGGLVCWPPAFR